MVEGYRWVITALIANIIINLWMGAMIGAARRRFNVPYPTMYASETEHKDAKAFNCVQRAHQNTLEFAPSVLVTLLIGGLQYPLVAAALGAAYGVARIQYFRGYSSGDAKKRFSGGGVLIFPFYFGLIFCTICFALHQFFPNLL